MTTKRKEESLARTMGKSRTNRPDQSRPESERDSGFSDASSEHLSVTDQAESDDGSRVGGVGKRASRSSSQPSQLAVVGGFSPNLSPMIIMNNVFLKQPGDNPPTPALKPWSFSPTVEMVQQPQVVFLQPVVSARAPSATAEPPNKRRRHKKYLPILKSYPKIAPHPGDSPHQPGSSSSSSSSSSNGNSTTSSSSSCSSVASSVKSCSLTSSHQERHGKDKQGSVSGCSTPSTAPASPLPHVGLTDSTPEFPTRDYSKTPEISALQRPAENGGSSSSVNSGNSSPSVRSYDQDNNDTSTSTSSSGDTNGSNKRKRFCNTYNILSKSGLLDITLRTKELIRQNRRTQGDLDRLREHTNLFMEVLKSGDTTVFDQLLTSMQEEGNREKNA